MFRNKLTVFIVLVIALNFLSGQSVGKTVSAHTYNDMLEGLTDTDLNVLYIGSEDETILSFSDGMVSVMYGINGETRKTLQKHIHKYIKWYRKASRKEVEIEKRLEKYLEL